MIMFDIVELQSASGSIALSSTPVHQLYIEWKNTRNCVFVSREAEQGQVMLEGGDSQGVGGLLGLRLEH